MELWTAQQTAPLKAWLWGKKRESPLVHLMVRLMVLQTALLTAQQTVWQTAWQMELRLGLWTVWRTVQPKGPLMATQRAW